MDPVLDATLGRFYSDPMKRSAVGLGFVALTGCSFALVSGPPANHRQLPVVECTTSRLGPILDIVWTALQASNLLVAVSKNSAEWDAQFDGEAPFSRGTAIGLYSGFAALGAAGMYFGFTRTSACRDAKAEWMIRAMQGQGMQPGLAPQPGTWPPPPGAPPPPSTAPQPGTWPPPQPAPVPSAPVPAPAPSQP